MKNTTRTVIIHLAAYKPKSDKKLSEARRNELILGSLETGYKIAHHLLRGWNYQIPDDEFKSIVGLAICEAALHYREDKNTSFSTYAFYFIKGALLKAMSAERKHGRTNIEEIREDMKGDENEMRSHREPHTSSSSAPETLAHLDELRRDCRKALAALTPLEKEVVCRVHVLETKLAVAARELGYSRGYISEVRGNAFKKMRNCLAASANTPDFLEAA